MIVAVGLFLVSFMGFALFMLAKINPLFGFYHFDWGGVIIMFLPPIGYLWRLFSSSSIQQFDYMPRNKAPMEYLRRDRNAIDVKGTRIYSGESFLDVYGLGLVEDLGEGCVYTKGGKKKRFVLENVSFTPNPKYMNLYAEYYTLGFNNSDDLWNVLNGENLELMGKTYIRMANDGGRGAIKLLREAKQNKPEKPVSFKSDIKTTAYQDARSFVNQRFGK